MSVTGYANPASVLGEISLADQLEDWAAQQQPGTGMPAEVRALAMQANPDRTGQELECAWDAFRLARYERDGLVSGAIPWADYAPSLAALPPAERWQAAVSHACTAADEARAAIQFGIPGGTR